MITSCQSTCGRRGVGGKGGGGGEGKKEREGGEMGGGYEKHLFDKSKER